MPETSEVIDLGSVGQDIKNRLDALDSKFDESGNATSAKNDDAGNVISSTYMTKKDVLDVCNEVIAEG